MSAGVGLRQASVRGLLAGLDREIELLTEQGLNLERSLSGLLSSHAAGHGGFDNLQCLDLMLQHLGELRRFMATLADSAPEDTNLCFDRALEGLKLHAVRSRLGEVVGGVSTEMLCASSGEFEAL